MVRQINEVMKYLTKFNYYPQPMETKIKLKELEAELITIRQELAEVEVAVQTMYNTLLMQERKEPCFLVHNSTF